MAYSMETSKFPGTSKISPDGILQFGKHKGLHVATVLRNDPGWIRWAMQANALSEADFNSETAGVVSGKLEEQEAHADTLASFWPSTPEAYSTTRRVPDHELQSDPADIFNRRFFP